MAVAFYVTEVKINRNLNQFRLVQLLNQTEATYKNLTSI